METLAGKDSTKLQPMEKERQFGRSTRNPIHQQLNVFAPILKTHLLEDAGAFANATIIIAKNFNPPCGQISSPTNPWVICKMSFGSQWPDKQDPSHGVHHLMQHCVKVGTRNRKVTSLLWQRSFCCSLHPW